jgi:hypothetical protein
VENHIRSEWDLTGVTIRLFFREKWMAHATAKMQEQWNHHSICLFTDCMEKRSGVSQFLGFHLRAYNRM